jgi:hypothetical protein
MSNCGSGWGERCANANPYGDCTCSCGGANHGIYRKFRYIFDAQKTAPTIPPPPHGAGGGGDEDDDNDGEIIPQPEEDWLDMALRDRAAFAAGLTELGLDEKTVNEGLGRFDKATREAVRGSDVGRWSFRSEEERAAFRKFIYSHIAKTPIANWLGLLKREVEDAADLKVRIPLFKLHSPKVQGSKVSFVEAGEGSWALPWSITVFGIGTGRTRKFVVKYKRTFDCSNGGCKLIFVPIKLRVEMVATHAGGTVIGRGLRTEMVLERPLKIETGIASLSEEECSRELDAAEDFVYEADFSGDLSDDTHKEEWSLTCSETTETKLGVSALQSSFECRATVTREREIGLAFQLPAGHFYQLKQCREVRGIAWAVDLRRSDDADDAPAEQPGAGAPAEQPTAPVIEERGEPALPPPVRMPTDTTPFRKFLDSIGDRLSAFWRRLKS